MIIEPDEEYEIVFAPEWEARYFGGLPRKSQMMLGKLCDWATEDAVLDMSPEAWRRLWALPEPKR